MASCLDNLMGFIAIVILCLGDTHVGGEVNTTVVFQVSYGNINLSEDLDYAYAVGRLVLLLARGTSYRGGEYYETFTSGGFLAYGYASCSRRRDLAGEVCRECIKIADMEIYSRCLFPRRAQMVLHDCRLIYSDQKL